MDFQSTPLNVVELLIMSLGLVALYMLFNSKTDSNIPLLYYIAMIIFMSSTDRDVHPYLFYSGMALALMLRFEFMNSTFTKIIVGIEILAMAAIMWTCLVHIFGPGIALF